MSPESQATLDHLTRLLRESRAQDLAIRESTQRAIQETVRLLVEIVRRHPEIRYGDRQPSSRRFKR